MDKIKLESVVSIEGLVKESKNSLSNFEIQVEKIIIINEPVEELPIEINKENLDVNLDTKLNNRMLSLRHEIEDAIEDIKLEKDVDIKLYSKDRYDELCKTPCFEQAILEDLVNIGGW